MDHQLDSKTMAVMELALDQVCQSIRHGEQHVVRKRIAEQIIQCARDGGSTLAEFAAAGQLASEELPAAASN